jgi:hypothetical protein
MLIAPTRSIPGIVSRAASVASNGANRRSISAVHPFDGLIEEVDLRQDLLEEKRMVRSKAPLQGPLEGGEFLAQLPSGQVGQDPRIGRARDEGPEHRAAADAHHIGDDRSSVLARHLLTPYRGDSPLGRDHAPAAADNA